MRDNCTKERCQKDSHPQGDLLEKLELGGLKRMNIYDNPDYNVWIVDGKKVRIGGLDE